MYNFFLISPIRPAKCSTFFLKTPRFLSLVWGLTVWYIRILRVMKSIIRAKKSAEMRNLSPLSSCIRPSWRGGRRGRFSFHLLTLLLHL